MSPRAHSNFDIMRREVSRRRLLARTSAALAGSAFAAGLPMPAIAEPRPVKFTLAWLAQGSSLYVYVARAKGMTKARGIDLDISRGFGSVAAAQSIAGGQFEFGIVTAPPLALSVAKGLPLIALATCDYDSTMGVGVLADSPIQKPQDLAIKPPAEAREPAPSQPPAKIAERVEPALASPASPPAPASEPKGDQSGAQGAAPSSPATAPQNAPGAPTPSAGRAAMLVASADNPQKPVVSLGSTVWSLLPPAPGQPATVAVKADADIPDLKMHATMTLRKNTDPTLQATHTIDLKFSFADGAPITGFKDVGLPQMRKEDSTAAETLTSVKVKISDVYFLIALAKGDQDTARNLDLIQTRAWFDFPLLLNDNRIAKVVFQKSPEGEAMLAKAFDAWK